MARDPAIRVPATPADASGPVERRRLAEDVARTRNWKRFGPYLAERQWGTVREDYSEGGDCWSHFSHDQARSRAYRFGEDGLLGFTDRECRLCFSFAFWNEKDPILKERLFGLTGPQGNHGEDVKEAYFYLDSTPTHSYTKALYKYPQAEFPYATLTRENAARGRADAEFELEDTGVFDGGRYFDLLVETAKRGPDDVVIRLTATNRGPQPARLHVLPQLWFRNTWRWGRDSDGYFGKPVLEMSGAESLVATHATLGRFVLEWFGGGEPLFTENETHAERLFGSPSVSPFRKDAFHARIVDGDAGAVNPDRRGTKFAIASQHEIAAGESIVIRLRLCSEFDAATHLDPAAIDALLALRVAEADEFYASVIPAELDADARNVMRQAYAGLLFSKQFYHYVVAHWLDGDPNEPSPPPKRRAGRNADWGHVFMRDVISMPDKWEYPWFASWDLAFHMIPLAEVDPQFAKDQLLLLLREWYMHPSGQLPAYEFAFSDVNPPVHAWAAWRIYKSTGKRGARDRAFLSRVFQKLLLNFTWWVNRKDPHGRNLFSGGFLGLDNVGLFDRSKPLPTGGHLEQADGTAWMAFYAGTMLAMALELAEEDPAAEDLATKFLEHFVAIVDAINHHGGKGLWDDADGFYHDHLHVAGDALSLPVRSMVGLIPLFAAEILEKERIDRLPGFKKRFEWFLANRKDLARHVVYRGPRDDSSGSSHGHYLLAVPPRDRLERVLAVMLDESEFLSRHGLRSLSKRHESQPFVFEVHGERHVVKYVPGESDTGLFGGNSNWRGPIWFPLNYLLLEALERYHHFYGEDLTVELPTGSGRRVDLGDAAREIGMRLASLFLADDRGRRPCHGESRLFANDESCRDLVLFHEYFHGEDGRGLGASHQTGWTALVVRWLRDQARRSGGGSREAVDGLAMAVR
jgi:hypothetical protein